MFALLKQTRTGLFIAMIGLMLLSVVSPMITLANGDLVPGDDAVVSTDTNLYTDSTRNADVRAEIVKDTPVTVKDGPLTAADGSIWYYVRVWDLEGYIPGTDLDGVASTTETTDAAPATDSATTKDAAPSIPWKDPIAYGVARDNVTCRAATSTSAEKLATVSAGQTIEITGVETWVEGVSWTPVNCAGVGGFIATDYIATEAQQAAEQQAADQAAADQQATEEAAAQQAAAEQAAADQAAADQAATEEAAAQQQTAADAAAAETPAAVDPTPTEVVEAPVVEETPITPEPSADTTEQDASAPVQDGTAQQSVGTAYASDNVICRAAASSSAPQITVVSLGATVEITGADVTAEGMSWTPVNCAGASGFIATAYLTADAPAAQESVDATTPEAVATEETTPVAETPEAEATTPVADQGTSEVADQTATQTETAQDLDAADATNNDAAKADGATTPAASETPAATDETAPATTGTDARDADSATATAVATDDESATPDATATEEMAGTDAVTPAATPTTEATPGTDTAQAPAATETATAEATAETDASSGIAVAETASTAPIKDDQILGTATVDGTNGDGIACRTAPNADAAVIRVLPEGMSVFILSEPDDAGWMSVLCGDEVGYAHSMYLYQGGASSEFTASSASKGYITGTAGSGVNCRSDASINASVIGYFPEGSAVNVRGAAKGDWVPVVCGGSNGWVYGQYITAKASTSDSSTSGNTSGSGGTATVVGTQGDGLRCRSGASTGSSVITVMAEGTRVSVRGSAQGNWLPITCAGQAGYASMDFLSTDGGSGSTSGGSTSGGSTSGGGAASGTVTVSGTGGAPLNCRTGASTSYPVITAVAEGTVLKVRTAASNGWQGVECGGRDGYVSTMYITAGGSAPSSGSGSTGSGTTGTVTGTATVSGTQGDGLRCRSGASTTSSIITVLAPGSSVSLRGSAEGDWQPVICGGTNGYVYKTYLSTGDGSSAPEKTPTPTPAPSAKFGNGDHAKVTSNLNLRYEPSTGAGVATYAPTGTVVLITGGPAGNGYYPVNWDGLKGFMHGDYLTQTSEPLSKRGGSAAPEPTSPPTTGGGGSSATGNAIVDYALGYQGYPYVWATHGPYSFDCSGFTYWVIRNVVGKDIGYGLWTQVAAGTPVGRGELQPGDLVFFQNTYTAGLSHVGIYIGGDQFIHAENETTGVKISSLSSSYYSSRWYGAVRIR